MSFFFFFSSRRRHTRLQGDWSSDVCSSDLAALLRARWGAAAPYRLFVQGEAPRERLLQEFRADGNGVLLGTASFWEGVDVKGEALRLVVIEKHAGAVGAGFLQQPLRSEEHTS